MTKHTVTVQNPIVAPFFQPCVPNGIPQMLQSFDIKSGIHCLSYRDTFEVHQTKVVKEVMSMTSC